MAKFKVAYIDESAADVRRFQRFARNYFEVIPFKPKADKDATVNEIIESHVDALIADFDLSEQDSTIHYSGADLVSALLEEKELFPVFILTSFEDDAVAQGDDVNIVYEKSEMANGEKFLERVKTQIEKYHHKIDEAEKRILELIKISKERKLDAFEEEELIKWDALVERTLDKKSQIPDIIRQRKETDDLVDLLKKVDDLTNKLSDKKDE